MRSLTDNRGSTPVEILAPAKNQLPIALDLDMNDSLLYEVIRLRQLFPAIRKCLIG